MAKKTGYEAWEEEQKKKAEGKYVAPSTSVVRKKENITYKRPYSGDSENAKKTYKWEKEQLSGLSTKKYGRSYNDKFKKWATEQGVPENEHDDFRRFLDSQEDGVDPASEFMDDLLTTKNQRDRARMERNRGKEVTRFDYEDPNKQARTEERDGLLGFLDSTLGRASRSMQETILGEDFVNKQDENYRRNSRVDNQQMLNTTSREAEGVVEKGADIFGAILGEGAKYAPAYKVAGNVVRGGSIASELGRGAIAGGLVGTSRAIQEEVANGDEYGVGDWAKTIGLEAALAGGGDAAVSAVLRNINLKGQLAKLLEDQGFRNPSEEQMKVALEEAFGQKGNPTNVLANVPTTEPIPPQVPNVDEFLSSLQPQAIQPTRAVSTPDIRQPEIEGILNEQQNVFRQRQVEEDAFVQERLAPFNDMLQRSAEAEVQWKATKQSQSEAQRIKDTYGKIIIPKGNQADWGKAVPPQFRAKKGETAGIDIYRFAEDEGFESVDEAVQYLQSIDAESKAKLRDFKPADEMKISNDQLAELENAARQEFNNTSTAQGLDKLFDDLLLAQKDVETPPEVKLQQWLEEINPQQTADEVATTVVPEQPLKEESTVVPNSEINSSVGNAQATTPATPMQGAIDHGGKRAEGAKGNYKESLLKKTWNNFSEKILDDEVRIKSVENELEGRNRLASPGDLKKKTSIAKGAAGAAEWTLEKEVLPAFEKVSKAKGNVDDAIDYMYALHFKEIKAQNPDYKLPANLEDMNLDATIQMFENSPVHNEFVADMNKVMKNLREELVESGRISRQQADEMEAKYPNYMPKFRQQDLENPEMFDNTFYNDFSPLSSKNPVKGLKDGGNAPITNPIESLRLHVLKTKQSAANNRALQELDRLKKLDVDGKWIMPDDSKGGTPKKYYIDGQEHTVYVEKQLAEALDKAETFEKDDLLGFVKGLSKIQRLAITGNPTFTVRNLIRDIGQGWANSKAGLSGIDIAHSMLDIFSDGKWVKKSNLEDFYKNGAGMNSIWSQDSKQFRKFQEKARKEVKRGFVDVTPTELKGGKWVGKLFDSYREMLSSTENVMKLAEYRATKRKGGSDLDAAYNARDMLDFFRAGSSVRKMNPYVGFLNVTLRGRDKFVRSLYEGSAKDTMRVVWRNALLGAAPSALGYFAYQNFATDDQKKLIEEAPTYVRDGYWLFPHQNGKDLYRIPKPFETAALVSTPLENMLMSDKLDREVSSEIMRWTMNNILFDPSLNIATPIYESVTGVDTFTKAPIVPQRMAGSDPIDQRDIYTTKASEGLAEIANLVPGVRDTGFASPMMIDNFIDSLLPGTGRSALMGAERALDKINPSFEAKEVPTNAYKTPVSSIWEQFIDKGEGKTSNTMVGNLIQTRDRMIAQKKKYGEGGNYPEFASDKKAVDQAYKAFSDLSSEIRMIANDPDLTGDEKQQRMSPLIEQRNEIARNLSDLGIFSRNKR